MTVGPIKLGRLRQTNPRLDLGRIRILRAWYEGGRTLLGDDAVMRAVFPRYANEGDESYRERRATAAYENVFAQIVNHVVAGLAQDPAVFDDGEKDANAKLDDYWKQLMKDATPPDDDGPAKTFDQQLRTMACEALVTGFGWMLCDMPPPPPVPASSEAEQIARGDLIAYPVPYRADCVLDWEMDNGVFSWVTSYSCDRPAAGPGDDRAFTRHTWTVWERETFTKFVLELDRDDKDRAHKAWGPDDPVSPTVVQRHSFGRVPWVLFDACAHGEPTMHLGDVLESPCRDLFNETNGEAFLRRRAHYQQLYEFLGPEMKIDDIPAEVQQDPGRAHGRVRGPDVIQVRGSDDDARFVAPSMEAVGHTQKAIADKRQGITRVTGQLALSQDTSGAMLKRSGDSKKQDKIAEEIVLGSIGKRLLGCARQIAKLLAAGRGDPEAPHVQGYQRFDIEDADSTVQQAAIVETISIPSATFQVEYKLRLALAALGDDVDQDVRSAIRDDLEKTITNEQFLAPMLALGSPAPGEDEHPNATPTPGKPSPFGGAKPQPGAKP